MELADHGAKSDAPKGVGAYLMAHMREYGLLFALIAIMVFFQVVTDGTLLKPVNITNLFLQNSYIIIMALGMLVVIVSGNIDLSVGSVMGFIGALAAVMIVEWGWPMPLAVLACLLTGILIGAAQGYWVAYWKIPSFIVTLAGMLVFRGMSLWLLEGQSVGPFPKSFQLLSTGFIPDVLGIGRPNGIARPRSSASWPTRSRWRSTRAWSSPASPVRCASSAPRPRRSASTCSKQQSARRRSRAA